MVAIGKVLSIQPPAHRKEHPDDGLDAAKFGQIGRDAHPQSLASLHTIQAFSVINQAVLSTITTAYRTHLSTSPSHPITPDKFVNMAIESMKFASELAGYYSTLHERPINIAVFGGVKLDPEIHPDKYEEVKRLGYLAVKSGIGVKSGWGPGAMEASLLGGLTAYNELPEKTAKKLFPNGYATVGDKILIGREPHCPFAQLGASYDHFPVRKLALMGSDTAAFFIVEGGMGTVEELLELIAYMSRGYIEKRPINLVGKEYWGTILDALKELDPKYDFSHVKIIEANEFEKEIKALKPVVKEIQTKHAESPIFSELTRLTGRKYTDHYELWKGSKADDLSISQEITPEQLQKVNKLCMDISKLVAINGRRQDVTDSVIKLFVDHFYANTIFSQIEGPAPIALCGSQNIKSGTLELVRDLLHKRNPDTAILSRTPDKNVGLRISRTGLTGPEITDYRMRYTLSVWSHITKETSAQIFLPGHLDTAWGLLTAIVAEQTCKPDLDKYPVKIIFDPEGKIKAFYEAVKEHVCAPQYQYATTKVGDIPKIVTISDPNDKQACLKALEAVLDKHLPASA